MHGRNLRAFHCVVRFLAFFVFVLIFTFGCWLQKPRGTHGCAWMQHVMFVRVQALLSSSYIRISMALLKPKTLLTSMHVQCSPVKKQCHPHQLIRMVNACLIYLTCTAHRTFAATFSDVAKTEEFYEFLRTYHTCACTV